MKKLAIFLAIMMIPFSAFALDTISDSDLNDVTGQAGVSIFLNTIRIEKTAWTTGYGDEGENVLNSTNWLLIVDEGSTKEISFLGSRTLDIDIVSRVEFSAGIATGQVPGVLAPDAYRFENLEMSALNEGHTAGLVTDRVSDVAVVISLPDAIQIADFGTTKSIYLRGSNDGTPFGGGGGGTTANGDLMIKTYSGGGTTTITGAGGAFAGNNVHIGIMAHD